MRKRPTPWLDFLRRFGPDDWEKAVHALEHTPAICGAGLTWEEAFALDLLETPADRARYTSAGLALVACPPELREGLHLSLHPAFRLENELEDASDHFAAEPSRETWVQVLALWWALRVAVTDWLSRSRRASETDGAIYACADCGCTDLDTWQLVHHPTYLPTAEVDDPSGGGYYCPRCDEWSGGSAVEVQAPDPMTEKEALG